MGKNMMVYYTGYGEELNVYVENSILVVNGSGFVDGYGYGCGSSSLTGCGFQNSTGYGIGDKEDIIYEFFRK